MRWGRSGLEMVAEGAVAKQRFAISSGWGTQILGGGFHVWANPRLCSSPSGEYTLPPICCTFPGPLPPQLDWAVSTDDGPNLYIQPILPRSLSMKRLLAFSAVFLFVSLPPAARADAVDQCTITSGGNIATFTLPASPTPTGTDAACIADLPPEFCISGVSVVVNGLAETGNTLEFFDISQLGGLAVTSGDVGLPFIDTIGAQLYSRLVPAPTFL